MATGGKQRGDDEEEARRVSLLNADVRKEDWQVAAASDDKPLGRRVWEESGKLWVIVAPAIFSRVVTYSMNVITQAFAGHLGDLELAAISIANTVVVGFNFGLMVRTCTPPPLPACLPSSPPVPSSARPILQSIRSAFSSARQPRFPLFPPKDNSVAQVFLI